MGRAKMKMDLIQKEKARKTTYKKRKEGLIRKMHEFTTLCGVKAGLIMYDPTKNIPQLPDEVWPKNNEEEIKRLINLYQSNKQGECSSSRNYGLKDYFVDKNKKMEDELQKLRKDNLNNKYPTWFDFMNDLSEKQLREFANYLNNRIDFAKNRLESMKTQQMQQQTQQQQISGLIHKGIELELTNQQLNSPVTMASPVAASAQFQVKHYPQLNSPEIMASPVASAQFQVKQHYPGSGGYVLEQKHQNQSINENSSTMMFLLNNNVSDHQALQFDGGSGSLSNYDIQRSLYYDSAAGGLVYNNPMPWMMSTLPMLQPPPYMQMQYPMVTEDVSPEMLRWRENQVDWPHDIYHHQFMPRNPW